jgi:hypothetical protein
MAKQTKAERDAALREYRAARQALDANKDKTETDRYLRANQRVIDAEKGVPWYRQVALTATDAGGSGSPVPGPPVHDDGSDMAALADGNGNGHGVTLKAQAEREALAYLERHGVLPSENVLAGLAGWKRGTARNALTPLRKG